MMKKLLIAVICMLPIVAKSAVVLDLEYVRKNYAQAANNKEICKTLITQLTNETSSNVHLAYLGALQTIWAKHVGGPTAKLKTFNEGKKKLEKAVKADSNNIEIRFLRFSVQENAPWFLNYRDNKKEDKDFIIKHKGNVRSSTLLKMINEVV
ncbi:hypothetical protein MG290_11125 [Flavobacterium sp. CBA20B-1]|uniref:hypothetical protein n=1 Tax=unclassified Flavobacterium TaxID=196869 RepID=UPI00222543EE|nr:MULTISPECIES: hypothetical protein [unclassified Flavobacterium]WCM41497.1 hypothetical protein MG290_11125 [Flavobacterium sp. CBA20B-1]